MDKNLADKLFSAFILAFLFATIFIVIYESRREAQWQHFIKEYDCKIVEEVKTKAKNWDGVEEEMDEMHYLCNDGFVYVR